MKQYFDKSHPTVAAVQEYKEETAMKEMTFDQLLNFIKDKKDFLVSIKIDGEIGALEFINGESIIYSREGRARTELPVTDEVTKICKDKKIEHLVCFGELYVVNEEGIPLRYPKAVSTLRKPKSPEDEKNIRFLVFDLKLINSEDWSDKSYEERINKVKEIFSDSKYVTPAIVEKDNRALLEKLWTEVTEGEKGYEGLVLHMDKSIIKVKPLSSLDAVVVGIERSETHPDRMGALHLALLDKDNIFRCIGKCGGGFTDEERVEWLAWAERNAVEEDGRDIFVNPYSEPRIVEVTYELLNFVETIASRFNKDTEEWVDVGKKPSVTLRNPRLGEKKIRTDKSVNTTDLRMDQLPGFTEDMKIERKATLQVFKISGTLLNINVVYVEGKEKGTQALGWELEPVAKELAEIMLGMIKYMFEKAGVPEVEIPSLIFYITVYPPVASGWYQAFFRPKTKEIVIEIHPPLSKEFFLTNSPLSLSHEISHWIDSYIGLPRYPEMQYYAQPTELAARIREVQMMREFYGWDDETIKKYFELKAPKLPKEVVEEAIIAQATYKIGDRVKSLTKGIEGEIIGYEYIPCPECKTKMEFVKINRGVEYKCPNIDCGATLVRDDIDYLVSWDRPIDGDDIMQSEVHPSEVELVKQSSLEKLATLFCPICDLPLTYEGGEYVCPKCYRRFESTQDIEEFKEQIKPDLSGKYRCTKCGKTVTWADTEPKEIDVDGTKRHIRIHKGCGGEEFEEIKDAALKPGTEEHIVIPKNEFYPEGLTKQKIYDWFKTVGPIILPYIKGQDLMLWTKTDSMIIRRKEDDKIQINSLEDLEKENHGRLVSINPTIKEETVVAWVDLDAKEKFPFEDTKKIALELYDLLEDIENVEKVDIKFSGSDGFHLIMKLNKPVNASDFRENLKDYLNEYITTKGDDRLHTGVTKEPNSMRLDVSTLHGGGSISSPYSIHPTTGLVSLPLKKEELLKFKKEDATIDKVLSKLGKSTRSSVNNINIQAEEKSVKKPPSRENKVVFPEGYKGGRFVIQRHDAKRAGTHYDFRLEVPADKNALEKYEEKREFKTTPEPAPSEAATVLESWAIRYFDQVLDEKKARALAINVEPHEISYLNFEGFIPPGQYGAGLVSIFDSGTYEIIENKPNSITIRLNGSEIDGTFKLYQPPFLKGDQWYISKIA
jgi:DNA-directed RNA polymerase subunit RPC12/RpoP